MGPAFRRAAETIRLNQTREGYWKTSHTRGTVFEKTSQEVNVFVPALMVDLLQPVAKETGLTDVLDRARGYLRRQIEATGLVRYHGRPDQPYIPRFGCVITPDSDDTALVWSVAPNDDTTLLRSAMQVFARYRTKEGLYRTWLAEPDAYRCVSRTDDPNPADVGIQMHLYLFFNKYDPAAGHRLCDALRQRISEGRIWEYYALAPLVPLMREVDLARAGCPIRVPEDRLGKAPPGQDPYIALGRHFRELLLNHDPPPSREAIVQSLQDLAAGNFARLESTPPLLYHNGLSGSTPRFYWSVDVGYAIWLRLYVETAHKWGGTLPLPPRSAKTS